MSSQGHRPPSDSFQHLHTDLVATSPEAYAVLDRVVKTIIPFLPQRKLRSTLAKYIGVLDVLLANLIVAYDRGSRVVVKLDATHWTRQTRSRYGNPDLTAKAVKNTIVALESTSLITVHVGNYFEDITPGAEFAGDRKRRAARATTIAATDALITHMGSIYPADHYHTRESAEVVILKKGVGGGSSKPRDWREYTAADETPTVALSRTLVRALNRHTQEHPIEYLGDLESIPLERTFYRRQFASVDDTIRWDQYGRLHGHWVQNLPSRERKHLVIDDEGVADVDIAACMLTVLHAYAGKRFDPNNDPYHLHPQWKRSAVKLGIVAMLNAPKRLKVFPQEISHKFTASSCPDGTSHDSCRPSYREFEAKVFERYPFMAEYVYRKLGMHLMFHESEIMGRVLLQFIDEGVGLGYLYDGLLVAASQAEWVREVIVNSFTTYTAEIFNCPVTPKVRIRPLTT